MYGTIRKLTCSVSLARIIASLVSALLFAVACAPRPQWHSHGEFKLRIPAHWANTPWDKGGRMFSRAETSAFVIVEPIADVAVYKQKVGEAVDSKKAAYGSDRVVETSIDAVGSVRGVGTKITLLDSKGEVLEETLIFMPAVTTVPWLLSAGCSSGAKVVWDEYLGVLGSFSKT